MKPETDAINWRRSSFCHMTGCVEVALIADYVMIRDSKAPHRAMLECTIDEWQRS